MDQAKKAPRLLVLFVLSQSRTMMRFAGQAFQVLSAIVERLKQHTNDLNTVEICILGTAQDGCEELLRPTALSRRFEFTGQFLPQFQTAPQAALQTFFQDLVRMLQTDRSTDAPTLAVVVCTDDGCCQAETCDVQGLQAVAGELRRLGGRIKILGFQTAAGPLALALGLSHDDVTLIETRGSDIVDCSRHAEDVVQAIVDS